MACKTGIEAAMPEHHDTMTVGKASSILLHPYVKKKIGFTCLGIRSAISAAISTLET